MGFPTKVQLIQRKASEQWYINFPSAVAQAMEFSKGETVEWIIEDKAHLVLRRLDAPATAMKKKTALGSLGLVTAWDALWRRVRTAFGQERTWRHARDLAMSSLTCLGRHTVSGMISAAGRQFQDWSSAYRLFEQERFDAPCLWNVARQETLAALPESRDFVALVDDTHLRKRGRKVHGASWRRDPLGPHFHTNFIWGQRFLQLSAALPEGPGAAGARAIPIDLVHCPLPPKPRRDAPPEVWNAYDQACKEGKISRRAGERLQALRAGLDHDPQGAARVLIAVADGGYTNQTVLKRLPDRTTFIGRFRKDAKLFAPPPAYCGRGRCRVYGDRLPTPQEIRQDDATYPWTTATAFAAGKLHSFRIKTLSPIRWAGAGPLDLRLVVIAPLGYRLTQGGRLLYRDPAYLICTDPDRPLEQVLQYYLWRTEIELNFRDEKTLLGLGQAQVRTPAAAHLVPTFQTAAYAFLLLATHTVFGSNTTSPLPNPKWRDAHPPRRITTAKAISLTRADLWGRALAYPTFPGFAYDHSSHSKPRKTQNPLVSAVLYATK